MDRTAHHAAWLAAQHVDSHRYGDFDPHLDGDGERNPYLDRNCNADGNRDAEPHVHAVICKRARHPHAWAAQVQHPQVCRSSPVPKWHAGVPNGRSIIMPRRIPAILWICRLHGG